MKKKLTVLLILMALSSVSLFAAFMQVGPTVTYNVPVDLEAETPVDFQNFNPEDFTVGADARFNFWFIQLQAQMNGAFDKELRLSNFGASAAANLRFNLVIADITVGGGLRANGNCTDGKWTINEKNTDEYDAIFQSSELFYRAGLALNFGRISLSAEASAPLNMTVEGLGEEKNQSVLEALTPDLAKTQVTVGLLFNFF